MHRVYMRQASETYQRWTEGNPLQHCARLCGTREFQDGKCH